MVILLTNPPEGDRSGGAVGVGVGTAVGVGVCETKTAQFKECGKKSRIEMRLDLDSSLGCCPS